ncbi:spherulin-2A-like [Pectinophora gossypiella]|uniref:spherulin-2A-like n=1 Tax=Pectinophora gossypiella TaxID=13191 RepID=UPI00214EB180|nr:spherulin-2A-like [Pectinophora gossypiella]
MAAFLLLLLPALAMARIQVEVSGEYDSNNPNLGVYVSGSESDVISDQERNTFALNDNNLKDAVRAYFGQRPNDAYVRSPTPWGDLYKTYGWSQVLRSLVPRSGRIVKITSEPQIIMKQIFENNSTKPATFNVGISQSVQNTVSSSWQTGHQLSVGQEIKYEFNLGMKFSGTTKFSYTSSWGQSTQKSTSVTIGATSAMQLTLQPGQSVLAELHASRGNIQVEIEYEANLAGATAVNYANTYKGHHFWALDVRAVMSAGGLKNSRLSKETINIGFYSDARVIVHDREIGQKLMEVQY